MECCSNGVMKCALASDHYSITPLLLCRPASPLGKLAIPAKMNAMDGTLTASMIRREIDNGICLLIFDRPESGANIFDAATLRDLDEQLEFIEGESGLRGLVITSAKKSIFIAGADLKTLLRQAQSGEMRAFIAEGQRVFNRIAALKIPTCAAIHGACAGGGYEITLTCDWRVASDDPATRIGLPETTLGLIPAWGGTTRLPRLVGPEKAREVILKGKLYSATEAKMLGLVEEVVSREQLLERAKAKIRDGKRKRAMEGRAPATPGSPEFAPPKASGNIGPALASEIITKGLSGLVNDSLKMELDAIVNLGQTEATQNLIRNFFLAEKYKKGSGKGSAEKIAHAAVIGAGVMGSGIAQWLSSWGVSVILRDVAAEQLNRGISLIEKIYADAVKRGIVPEEKAKQGRARVVASAAPIEMRNVQVVIEAASEKLEIKKRIFRDLDEKAPNALILATNTSALPISDLAAETKSPGRVIGLHFFNPVSRMKLVEVVVGEQTADETIERALAFVRHIGKLPVVVRDSPGFLVNRVLFPYLLDAAKLFENGMRASEIDGALVKWGMPMGPLRLIDEIGVDITVDIAETLERAYGQRDQPGKILREMLAAKMLGRKSGSGFYKYEGKTQTANAKIEKWRIKSVIPSEVEESRGESLTQAQRDPSTSLRFGRDDIAHRLIFLMVNEAALCLEEKVVQSPEDADYGMILGTGFAPFRGGPLRFAEQYGLKTLVEELDQLAAVDEKFKPCELLRQHAQNGRKFYTK
jgi:3-hydroxyacyl-CoA dehydrogenase / enoyl-CoA hydratase / 3-hydroxybutyryl-CoA epimerase